MTLLALRLLLGGWASKVWAFLCHRSFWQLVCMGCAVLIVVQHFELVHARSEAGRWHKQFDAEHAGRAADRASYVKAQTDAATANKAHVASIEAQQKRISDERLKSANDRLARLSDELRAHGPAAQGHSNGAASPPVPGPATRDHGSSGLCLSSAQLLRAAQDEERHDQLITWIEQQLTIDPNEQVAGRTLLRPTEGHPR